MNKETSRGKRLPHKLNTGLAAAFFCGNRGMLQSDDSPRQKSDF